MEEKNKSIKITESQMKAIQIVIQMAFDKGLCLYSMDLAKDLVDVYYLLEKSLTEMAE